MPQVVDPIYDDIIVKVPQLLLSAGAYRSTSTCDELPMVCPADFPLSVLAFRVHQVTARVRWRFFSPVPQACVSPPKAG
jgi:hypothetical protein